MVNKFSYYSTMALMAGAIGIFVTAPIIGMPSFGAFLISFGLAIAAAFLLVEYIRRFSPDGSG